MTTTLNTTLATVLAGTSGLLFPVNPADKKSAGAPDYSGFLEKQEKSASGEYKTIFRMPLVAWNSTSKDGKTRFMSVSVCDGLVRGALFKNDKPTGATPPDAMGNLGDKDAGNLGFAARKSQDRNGGLMFKLSAYAYKEQNAPAANNGHASAPADQGDPFAANGSFNDDECPF